jgi:tRNA threonylcarbamoyladenosine biosynthesis protein TsaE
MTDGRESLKSSSPDETERFGTELAGRLSKGDVVGLVGELGSGKTCFVRGLARGLGSKGYIKSPSFTIINIYEGGRLPLYHIDLYRIARVDDLFETGLEEYIPSNGVSVIEWADRFEGVLNDCTVVVRFSYEGEGARRISVERRSGYFKNEGLS